MRILKLENLARRPAVIPHADLVDIAVCVIPERHIRENTDRAVIGEPRYSNFVADDLTPTYRTRIFDPRTPGIRDYITKNSYVGSKFYDGIGGVFHGDGEKYSNAFTIINKAKGYTHPGGGSDVGNDIIQFGNVDGSGYLLQQTMMQKYTSTVNVTNYQRYEDNSYSKPYINTERTIVQDNIPLYNDLVLGSQIGNDKLLIAAGKDLVGKGATWEKFYTNDQKSKPDKLYNYGSNVRSDIRLRTNNDRVGVSGFSAPRHWGGES